MESQSQNPEFSIYPENLHPCEWVQSHQNLHFSHIHSIEVDEVTNHTLDL